MKIKKVVSGLLALSIAVGNMYVVSAKPICNKRSGCGYVIGCGRRL